MLKVVFIRLTTSIMLPICDNPNPDPDDESAAASFHLPGSPGLGMVLELLSEETGGGGDAGDMLEFGFELLALVSSTLPVVVLVPWIVLVADSGSRLRRKKFAGAAESASYMSNLQA